MTFDPTKPIRVETDSSDFALGAVLSQQGPCGRWRPVAFFSRALITAELNYEIYDKELLAIVMALREWDVYLEGSKYEVDVFSDHKNLIYFTTTKVLNRRQVRWAETLASYNYKIIYVKKTKNVQADILNKKLEYVSNKTLLLKAILKVVGDVLVYNKT